MLRFVAESQDRLLSGRYRLIDQIGRGGMGTVWWAHDEVEDREVAVKEVHIPPSLGPKEQANLIRRTHREAMAAGRLHHAGLIAMYDVVVEDGRPWLVMEYVPARSLEDVFVDDGPISPHRVADVGRRLLAALSAAHAAGIVHRDVKPSNVLLASSGRVVLTDFGIATYEGATTLTQSGTFMGSPAYVAPEVACGERATPSSDLWSLGATLYAAVEGRPPYDHETAMATLSALVTKEPDPPVRAGPLRPLLEGLLCKDPARRLDAPRADALLAAVLAPPPPARPVETRPRPASAVRRRLLVPVASGAVLALAVAAGVVAGVEGWTSPRSTGPATVPPPSPASSPTIAGPAPPGSLPPTIVARPGGAVARLLADGSGNWPGTATLTLRLPRGERPAGTIEAAAGPRRVSVLVTCPSGARRLSFAAYAVGRPAQRLTGTCAAPGHVPVPATLRLPGGDAGSGIRIRVRPGAGTNHRDTIGWLAGVYTAAGG
jgi:hypothetical protein